MKTRKKFTLHSGEKALEKLKVVQRAFALAPRFDIAPGERVGAVWNDESGHRFYSGFRWGLEPRFWDESHDGHRLFSARAETLAQKPAFSEALKFRRAVVPVDGIWQWGDVEGEKRPFLLRARGGENGDQPLFLAALWEEHDGERQLAFVNVEANRLIEPFGDRMPAILRGDDVNVWLESAIVNEKPLLRALKTPPARGLLVVPTQPGARGWASLREADDARDALTWVFGPRFDAERPRFAARKRMVLRDHAIGGHVFFRTRSFTRDDATKWHPVVDLE